MGEAFLTTRLENAFLFLDLQLLAYCWIALTLAPFVCILCWIALTLVPFVCIFSLKLIAFFEGFPLYVLANVHAAKGFSCVYNIVISLCFLFVFCRMSDQYMIRGPIFIFFFVSCAIGR